MKLSHTPEWRAWSGAKHRCTSQNHPAWADYGGRGITMCDEWMADSRAFIAHIGPKPSPDHQLDRIDNDRGYEPGNVRWATGSENSRNRRSTLWVQYQGERAKLTDLCDRLGLSAETVRDRLGRGWSVKRAIEKPVTLGRPKVDPEVVREILRLETTGMSMRAIGRATGVSGPTVARALRAADPPRRQ